MKPLDWKDGSIFFREIGGQYVDGLEFCKIADRLFKYVLENDHDGKELNKRPRNIKVLIEEILPISVYTKAKYKLGNSFEVCWASRTQPIDAEIQISNNSLNRDLREKSYYLEVTCAVHPKEYLVRELLNAQGYSYAPDGIEKIGKNLISECISYENYRFIDHFVEIINLGIKKKANKDYPENTILIVCCELDVLYTSREWSILEEKVTALRFEHNFKEIFIYNSSTKQSFTIS